MKTQLKQLAQVFASAQPVLLAGLLGVSISVVASSAHASGKKTCKVTTTDIGTIVGRGPSSEAAFEDAATQCFDRRSELYRMKKGASVDEDSGLVMIDVCANIKCS